MKEVYWLYKMGPGIITRTTLLISSTLMGPSLFLRFTIQQAGDGHIAHDIDRGTAAVQEPVHGEG